MFHSEMLNTHTKQYKYIVACEDTPNPSSYKWIINYDFAADEMYEYDSYESACTSPLALSIWQITHKDSMELEFVDQKITRIFFHDNMIVVHKNDDSLWNAQLLDMISDAIDNNVDQTMNHHEGDDDTIGDTEKMILDVMQNYIQPAVRSHGGLIKFHYIRDGIVYVSLHGACNGCDSASKTLYDGVENILKFYVPGVLGLATIEI